MNNNNTIFELYKGTEKIAAGTAEYVINALALQEGVNIEDAKGMKTIKARFYEFAKKQRTEWHGFKIFEVRFNSEISKFLRLILRPFYNLPETEGFYLYSVRQLAGNALTLIENYLFLKGMELEEKVVSEIDEIIGHLYKRTPKEFNPFAVVRDAQEPLAMEYLGVDENGESIYEMERLGLFDSIEKNCGLNRVYAARLNKIRKQYQLRDSKDMLETFAINFGPTYLKYYTNVIGGIETYFNIISTMPENYLTVRDIVLGFEDYDEKKMAQQIKEENRASQSCPELVDVICTCKTWGELEEYCNSNGLCALDYQDLWIKYNKNNNWIS